MRMSDIARYCQMMRKLMRISASAWPSLIPTLFLHLCSICDGIISLKEKDTDIEIKVFIVLKITTVWKFNKCWKCLLWYSSAMTPMLLYISSRMLLHRIRVQAHEWRNKKPFLRKLFSSRRHPRYIWISYRSYFWAYCQSIVKPLFDFCEAKLVHPAKVLTYNNYFTKPLQNQFGILTIY